MRTMPLLFVGSIERREKAYILLKVHFWERGKQEWESILGLTASVEKLVLI